MYKICNETNMEDIAKLEKEIFKFSGYSYKELCEMNQKKELYSFFSAKDEEDKMVGYIILFDNSDSLEIMKIGVLPGVRQRGIASLLIDEVKRKDRDIFLEVRENNMSAIKFYEKNSFAVVGKRKNYYSDTGESAILMMWQK